MVRFIGRARGLPSAYDACIFAIFGRTSSMSLSFSFDGIIWSIQRHSNCIWSKKCMNLSYLLHFCLFLFTLEIPTHSFCYPTLDVKFGSVAQLTTCPINRELLVPATESYTICR